MLHHRGVNPSGLLAAVLLLATASLGSAGAPAAASAVAPTFITGPLPPPPPGSTHSWNLAAEPQIRSSPSGSFYISSENGLGAGTEAWLSTDAGLAYQALAQPNAISSANASGDTGVAPGGGDTDLAVAPVKNTATSNGQYNVYVASLTLGDVTVSLSQDGGLTWSSNELGASVPGDDREWIAAYGPSTYYVSCHSLGTGDQVIVNEGSVVSGTPTSVQTYDAIDPAQTDIYLGTEEDNEIGNIAVDQASGRVYQVFAGCPPSPTAIATCPELNTIYMAVGTPTGQTAGGEPILSFTDSIVYEDPNPNASLANNFPNVAVDGAGNVYAAWSDDQNVYVSASTDHGTDWSSPVRVNSGSAATAIYPWMAAGAAGEVDMVYYATPASANFQSCSSGTPGPYDLQVSWTRSGIKPSATPLRGCQQAAENGNLRLG